MNVMLALAKAPHTHTVIDFFDRHMFVALIKIEQTDANDKRPSFSAWIGPSLLIDREHDGEYDPRKVTPKTDHIGCFTKELWI